MNKTLSNLITSNFTPARKLLPRLSKFILIRIMQNNIFINVYKSMIIKIYKLCLFLIIQIIQYKLIKNITYVNKIVVLVLLIHF